MARSGVPVSIPDFIGLEGSARLNDWRLPVRREICGGRDSIYGGVALAAGIEMAERGIPRHGYPVLHKGATVGKVTSGTKSPSTGKSIGLAYVPSALSAPGTKIDIDCRGRVRGALVVKTPFYVRPKGD